MADDAKQKLRLTERRIKILKEVGFSWGDRHLSFDEYFDWLLKFKQEKGHCNVPTKSKGELKALGRWVQEIRLKYKRQKKRDNFERLESDDRVELTEEQMTRLNSIGFKWKMFDRNPNSAPGKKRKGDE